MNSSRNSDLILSVFSDTRTVFSLNDVAMLIGESEFKKLNERSTKVKKLFANGSYQQT
jgi:hypothetical protein